MMRLLGAVHLVLLLVALAPAAWPLRARPVAALAALGLLAWTNLVLTGQLLSLGKVMNVAWLYAAASLALAAGMTLLMRRLAVDPPLPIPVPERRGMVDNAAIALALAIALVVLALNVLIGVTHLPSNPDTVVYRFPRIYWYLGAGSLAHFAAGSDPRVIFYPTNGPLLYYPLALYRFGALWFNAPTLLAWCGVGLITWTFARELGARAAWAAVAAVLIVLTPNVLIQALSTNDEILAAAAMLAGLFFLHRWSRSGSPCELLLAACGVGLSVGTKLHVFFYWPYLILIAGVALWHWRALFAAVRPLFSGRGAVAILGCCVLAVALVGSFIIYNKVATGEITEHGFARQVLNTPFDPRVSLQTIALYAAQIGLAPLTDLLPNAGVGGGRAAHYAAFNAAFAPFFGWVDNSAPYMSAGYRFTGLTMAVALLMNEHTVLIGYAWLAGLVAILRLAFGAGGEGISRWAFWIALSGPAWFLGWAASTKYIEGIGAYLTYAAIISAPGWAFAFAPIASVAWSRARWAALGFVVVTHALTTVTVKQANTARSLPAALRALGKPPVSTGFTIDASVTDETARAAAGVSHRTIVWGQPFWTFMAFNPRTPQFLLSPFRDPDPSGTAEERALRASVRGLMPAPGDATLHVYPFRQFPAYGHAAIQVPGKATPGLTHIGNLLFALGPEWVFAAGAGVEMRHPGKSGYVVLSFTETVAAGQPVLDVASAAYGLGEGDDLAFRYDIVVDGQVVDSSDWSRLPAARLKTTGLGPANGALRVHVRTPGPEGRFVTRELRLRSATSPGAVP